MGNISIQSLLALFLDHNPGADHSEEQKKPHVELFSHGKPRSEIIREYDLTASAFDKWVKRINATGSSREKDNRTFEEQELIELRKETQQLRMENDI